MWQWWGISTLLTAGFIHTKGKGSVKSYLAGYGVSPKQQQQQEETIRGTSILNESLKASENWLVDWKGKGKEEKNEHFLNTHHVSDVTQDS